MGAWLYALNVLVDAVIVAAGSSTRFGEQDKLLADLCGAPVLARALDAYQACPEVGRMVVVVGEATAYAVADWKLEGRYTKLAAEVEGGPRRRDSVEAGLKLCRSKYVAVHDGARPLVRPELISEVVRAAEGQSGAIAATPVSDTVKEVRGGLVVGHPERSRLWAAQTPQVVLRQAWLDAAAAGDDDETDDAAMLARLGLECVVVEGSAENLKITRPVDLEVARMLWKSRIGKEVG